jgi:beta-1,4-mannosyl-glycoprotein beta-1,4-N-acetylglucosaminyltransferase
VRAFALSPYFGEDEVLEIKVAEQAPYVDVFGFIEARTDHQGRKRRLRWSKALQERLLHLAGPYDAEIRYEAIALPESMAPWEKEGYQRETLGELATDVLPDDLVIVSDLDEILRGAVIHELRGKEYTLPAQIAFPIHPYRLDYQWKLPVEPGWCLCTAVSGAQMLEWGTQRAVKEAHKFTVLAGPYGWHFTYQGDPQWIVTKAKSIADGWTGELVSLEAAERAVATGADVFGRERPVRQVELHELPVYVQQNQARFRHLLRGASMAKAKKSDREKQLEALAKQYGAELSVDGDAFVLALPDERNTLRVTEDTEDHTIHRYLRGALG